MPLDEVARAKLLDDAGLASAAVADEDDLEEVVEALVAGTGAHQVVRVTLRHPAAGTSCATPATPADAGPVSLARVQGEMRARPFVFILDAQVAVMPGEQLTVVDVAAAAPRSGSDRSDSERKKNGKWMQAHESRAAAACLEREIVAFFFV